MDQNSLKSTGTVYIWTKIVQGICLFFYSLYLFFQDEEDTKYFKYASTFILTLVLISYYFVNKKIDKIINQNVKWSEYLIAIILDITIVITALFGYMAAIIQIEFEYDNDKMKLYYHHHKVPGLKEYKLSRASPYQAEETINESFETTTKFVVEQAISLVSNVTSSMGIKENFSEPTDFPVSEYNLTMNSTSVKELTQEMLDSFYTIYVTLQLLIPSLVAVLIQAVVVGVLGFMECMKYKIRKALQQEAHAMVAIGDAVDDN